VAPVPAFAGQGLIFLKKKQIENPPSAGESAELEGGFVDGQ